MAVVLFEMAVLRLNEPAPMGNRMSGQRMAMTLHDAGRDSATVGPWRGLAIGSLYLGFVAIGRLSRTRHR